MATAALPGFVAKLLVDVAAGTPAELGELRELSLSVEHEVIDATSHDSLEFREFIRGLRSWTITAAILHVSAEAEQVKVRAAILAGTLMDIEIREEPKAAGKPVWLGSALVSALDLSFPVDDAMTGDITLQGTGVLNESSFLS